MISFVTATVQILPRNQNPFPHPGLLGVAVLKRRTLPLARDESYIHLTFRFQLFLLFNFKLQSSFGACRFYNIILESWKVRDFSRYWDGQRVWLSSLLASLSRFIFIDVWVITAVVTESILGPAHFSFPRRDFTFCSVLFWNTEIGKGFSKTQVLVTKMWKNILGGLSLGSAERCVEQNTHWKFSLHKICSKSLKEAVEVWLEGGQWPNHFHLELCTGQYKLFYYETKPGFP